ncbi:ABC transporter ATP-binding protein [Schaalia sp. ZJ405]|uniref:ABC transporter ATP-binding protein n=1 Tax=unclassified Schaalia TaxID=2691889 RepID=UPI0013ECF4F5|nr:MULTISPECIES: ABC transporter ATP-binding protein [unclassified Schaalia]QPK81080.1 ABC transporter ATP-binding protein [Schaalia sp. ZJ405]
MTLPPDLVRIVDVGHEYEDGRTRNIVLTGINLTVAPGEFVAVMGPSGSGKSTLLNLVGGLEKPSWGDVFICGHKISDMDAMRRAAFRRSTIGYVFQEFNLIPSLSAVENVEIPLQLNGVPGRRAREEALAALDEVGVGDLAHEFPDRLSGGQRQRISIARAIVGDRAIILADEPTGALDSRNSEQIMRLLRERIDRGAGGILVTHEARYAAWADRTVFLRDGLFVDRLSSDSLENLRLESMDRRFRHGE